MSAEGERISVSRDTLRAELNDLKVDLIDRISEAISTKADGAIVAEHDKRITQLELSKAAREGMPAELLDLTKRVGALEKFRYAVPSAAIISTLTAVVIVVYYFAGAH